MNSPSRLSNFSTHTMNSTVTHNVERINVLAERLNQIQVFTNIILIKFSKTKIYF